MTIFSYRRSLSRYWERVPQPRAWMRSASCWLATSLSRPAFATFQDLAAQGQDGLVGTVARLFGRATCRVTLHDEEFGAIGLVLPSSRQVLPGRPQLAHGCLAGDVFFLATAQALIRAIDNPLQKLVLPGWGRLSANGQMHHGQPSPQCASLRWSPVCLWSGRRIQAHG